MQEKDEAGRLKEEKDKERRKAEGVSDLLLYF